MLTREEVTHMLARTQHKVLLSLIYSTGLPFSVLRQLHWEQLNTDRHYAEYNGKIFHLPWNTVQLVPKGKHGRAFSQPVEQIVRDAAKQANIRHPVTATTLRQSYPLHLVEKGVNIKLVRELLA